MTATETRIVEPGDPYADPPRDWRRVGMLAGAWLLVWVVLASLGWLVMRIPALKADDQPHGTAENPTAAVYSFLTQSFTLHDAATAQTFVCGDAVGVDAASMIAEVDGLRTKSGSLVTPAWEDLRDLGQGTVGVRVSYRLVKPTEDWTVTLADHDGWCISRIDKLPVVTPS